MNVRHAFLLAQLVATGAIGQGPTLMQKPPILYTSIYQEAFAEITAGAYHTCARKNNGNVYCWGINDKYQAGQFVNTQTCVDRGAACVDRPKLVTLPSSALKATQITAGNYHSCALAASGEAWCWGNGNYGELGMGFGLYGWTIPVKVASPAGVSFNSIGAGTYNTCGTMSGGGVFCWGLWGMNAQMKTLTVPTLFSGAVLRRVSGGYLYGCGFDSAGNTQCWGSPRYIPGGATFQPPQGVPDPFVNYPSVLGVTSHLGTASGYACADHPGGFVQCLAGGPGTPYLVGNGTPLRGVTTGLGHACALTPAGNAYCWGNGYYGQLGAGQQSVGVFQMPQLVTKESSAPITFRALAAGELHTCGIGTDNHIYCWGDNSFGQLGTQYPGGWVWNAVQALDP